MHKLGQKAEILTPEILTLAVWGREEDQCEASLGLTVKYLKKEKTKSAPSSRASIHEYCSRRRPCVGNEASLTRTVLARLSGAGDHKFQASLATSCNSGPREEPPLTGSVCEIQSRLWIFLHPFFSSIGQ